METERALILTRINELFELIQDRDATKTYTIYRGQREEEWLLLPKIDRVEFEQYRKQQKWPREIHEKYILQAFRKGVRPFVSEVPKDEFELMALAQHHGLATKLLDWTTNPLVGLYFAVEEPSDRNSVLWELTMPRLQAIITGEKPFDTKFYQELIVEPPHVSPRIVAQSALFTMHRSSDDISARISKGKGHLRKILIQGEARAELKKQLALLGITRQSLFPDLDGLAAHTNWRFIVSR